MSKQSETDGQERDVMSILRHLVASSVGVDVEHPVSIEDISWFAQEVTRLKDEFGATHLRKIYTEGIRKVKDSRKREQLSRDYC